MPDLFISYARGDDEPFVKQLYEDLTHSGYKVWWDRVSMPSRSRLAACARFAHAGCLPFCLRWWTSWSVTEN